MEQGSALSNNNVTWDDILVCGRAKRKVLLCCIVKKRGD